MNKEMIENEEILEEVEETTELTEVEKEGFIKKATRKVKEFGQSKAGKVIKTAGLIGAGFLAGVAVVKSGCNDDDSIVIDVTDDSVIISDEDAE